ncbi:MAG TPA: glutathione S-transferase family protein [Burkholderiaceae bacterium]|jgi:glutathione S-transferase|nr:glutathione S-transferase family protein [Burkholderiaceae bacterium]HQR75269.1 glutathione S-transferase family protein [Burkholderiaceae bacterium]
MITLHHCVGARSFRPLWLLEELGVKYELKPLPFPPRVLAKEYLAVNPLGTVPAFADGDTRMTESVAICHYLAERHGGSLRVNVAPDEPDYGRYLNFLFFGEATLTFPQTLVLRYQRFEPPERRQPQVADDYGKWFHARLRTLDAYLEQHDTICAGRFTAADVSVGYALLLADHIGLSARFSPSVKSYFERLRSRPAFVRAQDVERGAAEGLGLSTVPVGRIPAPQ